MKAEHAANDDTPRPPQRSRPRRRPYRPDAHGEAAMLVVESLIHTLIAGSVISVADAVETVDVAAEVKADIAIQRGDSPETMERSVAIITAISSSLRRDMAA